MNVIDNGMLPVIELPSNLPMDNVLSSDEIEPTVKIKLIKPTHDSSGVPIKFSSHELELFSSLSEFYSIELNAIKLGECLQKRHNISLRLIEWFVTNYSKQYITIYNIRRVDKIERFKVHSRYRAASEGYKKEIFDPFCRTARISVAYYYTDNGNHIVEEYESTIAQLNFFKWCVEYGIIEYIKMFNLEIARDMKNRCSGSVRRRDKVAAAAAAASTNASGTASAEVSIEGTKRKRKKREELSKQANSSCVIMPVSIQVSITDGLI